MQKKSIKILFASILFFSSVLLATIPANADEETTEKPEISQLLTPSNITIELEPGEVYTDYFEVYNTGTKEINVRAYALSHKVIGEDYKTVDYDAADSYSLIRNWITFSQPQYHIEPDDYVRVYYTVTVPEDVAGIGQYASLMSEIIEEDGSTISTINRVGINLNAIVHGETHEDGYGEIKENSINVFSLTPPISTTSLVKNNGNVQGYEHIIMEVYPLFSEDPAYIYDNDEQKQIVYPETERFITTTWNSAPKLGIFKVIQKIEFMGETSKIEKIVVICPIWLIFTIVVIILILIARARARKKEQ